ncbi:Pyridoxal kinase PdxY [Entomobacter blattae]|uniref:pyridoxal kinase n=2 Tax=Entomobacter blattae TaxID=2762277 RepID=A0A7H1NS17_9PROT|nr:Pyridoxal kinase PdxY [Entomobacter blattae]
MKLLPVADIIQILSIQSWVSYGHVGNSASMFPLQMLGAEVWGVNTVQFSNHTGYGAWSGMVFSGEQILSLVKGVEQRGKMGELSAVLSGYLGAVDIGDAVLESVRCVRHHAPNAFYCCDPVMGDRGRGMYVADEIPAFFAERALSLADIITPNHFELEYLAQSPITTIHAARQAMYQLTRKMHQHGPAIILATSIKVEDTAEDCLEVLAMDKKGNAFRVATPDLPFSPTGSGDLASAVFLFHLLAGRTLQEALKLMVSAIWGVMKKTYESGKEELQIIAARNELVHPSRLFFPEAF